MNGPLCKIQVGLVPLFYHLTTTTDRKCKEILRVDIL